jgi:hypothetical protein
VNTTQLTEFYSSHIPTSGQSLTTVKMDMDHYTGTVKFQAAENYQSVWFDVTADYEFLNETSVQYFNILGYYPLMRASFNNSLGYGAQGTLQVTDGVVTGVQVTSGGSGYQAPPKVQILGNGAGATAEAVIQNGVVTSIIVTNGGSGYLPIQYQSTNYGTALITNGTIGNLQYR